MTNRPRGGDGRRVDGGGRVKDDMALQGNLRDFSATEILQLLGTQKKTGCLLLEWNTEHALVYVQRRTHRLDAASPACSKDDPLLLFLLKIHRLSEEQYRGILTIQQESESRPRGSARQRPLPRARGAGRVTSSAQILDDLMRVTRWENGTYRFDPNNRWPTDPLVQLSIEGALIEAARRADEQKRFVTVFKDPYQLLGVLDLPDPYEPLTDEERELFGIIDGHHTVAEVVEAAPLSEYETYEALHRMLEAHWLEFVGRRNPGLPRARRRSPADLRAAEAARRSRARSRWRRRSWRPSCRSRFVAPSCIRPRRSRPGTDPFTAAEVRDLRYRARSVPPRARGLSRRTSTTWSTTAGSPRSAPRRRATRSTTAASASGADYHLELKVDR